MSRCANYQFGKRRGGLPLQTNSRNRRIKKSDSHSIKGQTRSSTIASSSTTIASSTSTSSSTTTSASSTSTSSCVSIAMKQRIYTWIEIKPVFLQGLIHVESESPPNTSLRSNAIAMETTSEESSSELKEKWTIKYENEQKKFKEQYDAEMERINSEYEAAEQKIKAKHIAHTERINAEYKVELKTAKLKLKAEKKRIENKHRSANEMLEIRYCQISLPD